MGKNDWAVVAGIQSYFDPDLPVLEGPENDARDFYEWVISSDGGDVPKGQAQLIVSSAFNPPFSSAAAANPTAAALKASFDHLISLADENAEKEIGREVGDRLYVFLAGHGFAPSHRDDLTALLTAEASVANEQLSHVLGSYFADAMWRQKFFKEILLFMDCCRSIMECTQLFMPYDDYRASDYDSVRRFYAYGARVAKESREWQPPGMPWHGVFTMTLMQGLRGGAYHSKNPKVITAESLRDQLYNAFAGNMVPADRDRLDVPHEPEIVYEQKPGSDFTLVPTPARFLRSKPPQYPVRITAPANAEGETLFILDAAFKVVAQQTFTAPVTLSLERGFYIAVMWALNAEKPFEVTGSAGGVDVRL
jgi:hypothetical protein